MRPATVSKSRVRFAHQQGRNWIAGCTSARAQPCYDENTVKRILAKLDEPPPSGYPTWSWALVADALGQFVAKVVDIVGLHLDPPKMRWCSRRMTGRTSKLSNDLTVT
jgi:hypothetical protein